MVNRTKNVVQEIFHNPNDLEFSLTEEDGGYVILVRRGQVGQFLTILRCTTPSRSFNESVEAVRQILETIHYKLSTDDSACTKTEVLSPELIDKIIEELRQKKTVNTAELH